MIMFMAFLVFPISQVGTQVGGHLGRWVPRQVGTQVGGHLGRWAPRQVGTQVGGHPGRWAPKLVGTQVGQIHDKLQEDLDSPSNIFTFLDEKWIAPFTVWSPVEPQVILRAERHIPALGTKPHCMFFTNETFSHRYFQFYVNLLTETKERRE